MKSSYTIVCNMLCKIKALLTISHLSPKSGLLSVMEALHLVRIKFSQLGEPRRKGSKYSLELHVFVCLVVIFFFGAGEQVRDRVSLCQ